MPPATSWTLAIWGAALDRSHAADGTVHQTRDGINEIAYRPSLPRETLVVENEMCFPG